MSCLTTYSIYPSIYQQLSFNIHSSTPPPPPLHKGGSLTFSKLMEMGGVLKFLVGGGRVRQNEEVCLEMGGLPHYIEVFLEIAHDAAYRKKSWCVYLSFVNQHVLQNNCLKYEMIGIWIVFIVMIVKTAVLIIHANNKNSAWYFYLSYNVNKHVL